ncbi:hypothetical protein DNTS_014321, partial [Danionella cerebrum]
DLVKAGVLSLLTGSLRSHAALPELVKEVCAALRVLTFDDDVRVAFGHAHEHAKMIVLEHQGLHAIVQAAKVHPGDPAVLSELCATLSRLAVRNEFCQDIVELGGLKLMISLLADSMDCQVSSASSASLKASERPGACDIAARAPTRIDVMLLCWGYWETHDLFFQELVKQLLTALKAIAGNDDVKDAIVNAGGVELIVMAMNRHMTSAQVCEQGCAAMCVLALRKPNNCARIMESSGALAALQAMKTHPGEVSVQKQSCMLLRNLVSRSQSFSAPILELGAEALISQAMEAHRDCADVARAALRDLGCQVQLRELWTGTKGSLSH